MRKMYVFSVIIAFVFALSSCSKKEAECPYRESNIEAPESETALVEQYLSNKGITAQKDASGVYYVIDNEGSGKTPDVCSQITVHYTGSLVNGVVFDKTEGDPVTFYLGGLITGWQKGLKYIKEKGRIQLFIPPSLAYGNKNRTDENGNVVIPANSILVFVLDLVGVE